MAGLESSAATPPEPEPEPGAVRDRSSCSSGNGELARLGRMNNRT